MWGELAAIAAALSWAASAAIYKLGLVDASPFPANTARSLSTTLILLAQAAVMGEAALILSAPSWALWYVGLSALLGPGVGDTLYMLSLKLIGTARAVPIASTYPLFTALIALVMLGENVTPMVALGALLIVAGLWLVASEQGGTSSQRGAGSLGVWAAIGTSAAWGVSIASMAVALRGVSPVPAVTLRMMALTPMLLLATPLGDRKLELLRLRPRTWVLMALGGFVSMGVGWLFMGQSLLEIGAARAVPLSSISPVFAAFAGAVFLKEKVTAKVYAGAVLVTAGASLIAVS